MTLAHRIQLRPTVKQAHYFSRACGTARFPWTGHRPNGIGHMRRGRKPKAADLKRQCKAIQCERFPWRKGIHRDAHAQAFAQIASAWRPF